MIMLDVYRRVAEIHSLPPMQAGDYDLETRFFTDPDEVWSAIRALEPTQGWLQFQSCQMAFHHRMPQCEPGWGYLLAGEMVMTTGDSLALNPDGSGGWHLAQYGHHGQGDLLCDEVEQLAYGPKGARLRYRRYWRHDYEQGYFQACACLVGLD